MRFSNGFWFAAATSLFACGAAHRSAEPKCKEAPLRDQGGMTLIGKEQIESVAQKLVSRHGEAWRPRIEKGATQAAAYWQPEDGDADAFAAFCEAHFIVDEAERRQVFARFQNNVEQISGHLLEMGRTLREPTELDLGRVLEIDKLFAAYDLGAHVQEDFFKSKIAFVILLNFEAFTLEQKLAQGASWTRLEWAEARAAELFVSREPPEISQAITQAFTASDEYISNYNIHMHHLLTSSGARPFPAGLKLISHWGLRDELKSLYAEKDGLSKQQLIQKVMERIIAQEIPRAVVDNPEVDWNPETNAVQISTARDGEKGLGAVAGAPVSSAAEPDTRYQRLRDVFRAIQAADVYWPTMPSYVERKFRREREMPKAEVVRLLESVLRAKVAQDIAAVIVKRLGRPLEPFDIWYDGFSSREGISEEQLDALVRKRFSNRQALEKEIPTLLGSLGFDKETAAFLASKIAVDPARGAGHALGAERREDKAHLRTRIDANGMSYKGYNIAIHELGHNVEQVFSLNRMDEYLLSGVPNLAFTEGFAFAFQDRDLEILGAARPDPRREHLRALDTFWSTFEMSGVALVDIGIWDWMYAHKDAGPAELKQAAQQIAREVWNEYFASIYGTSDVALLAIYSHIIDAGLYLPDYPLGYLIQFQMRDHFKKRGLAREMERMCKLGSLTPELWMQKAVGGPISAEPLIVAAGQAVEALR